MATDALGVLQSGTTRTSAADDTAYDLKVGTPRRGLFVRFNYSGGSVAANAGTAIFTVDHSNDNVTWYTRTSGAAEIVALGTASAAAGAFSLPVETSYRYIRSSLETLSGSAPSIAYSAHVVLGRPG